MYHLEYSRKYHLTNYFLLLISLISIVIFFYSCSVSKRIQSDNKIIPIDKDKQIRVLLSKSKKIKFKFENESEVIDIFGRRINIEKNSSCEFLSTDVGIKSSINGNEVLSREFLIVPKSNNYLSYNGKSYRGYFKLVNNSNSILLVNYVDIESYVKGVILKEMPLGICEENFEAIKAFSILLRTYAVKKKLESGELFDLHSDFRDQIYGGMSSENTVSNSLVDFTKGQLLFYQGRIATVFYHSTCGGYTENVENIFNSAPIPYLNSIKDNNPANCIISPRFNWEESFDENLIIKRLLESNYISDKNSKIKSIEVLSRFNSGRVNKLKITLFENKKLKEIILLSNNIRFVFKNSKNNILPSSNFDVKKQGDKTYKFIGKGFGHGVGLCQWGSIKLSKEGLNFKEILNFYFPKIEIKKLND